MGLKLRYDDNSIKIYGNPNLELKKKIVIRVFKRP